MMIIPDSIKIIPASWEVFQIIRLNKDKYGIYNDFILTKTGEYRSKTVEHRH